MYQQYTEDSIDVHIKVDSLEGARSKEKREAQEVGRMKHAANSKRPKR